MTDMRRSMRKAGFKGRQRRRRRKPPQRASRRDASFSIPEFPTRYFLKDSNGHWYLDSSFVGKANMDALAKGLSNRRLTTGQTRRFFNHCRDIERRLKVDGNSWEQVSARFESLSYHAQNAVAAKKIPNEFQQFIDANVKRVVSWGEPREAFLNGFLPHFEALIGFAAKHMKDS